jgi:hypothetical protein
VNDDDVLTDVERRVRAVLRPDQEQVRHVIKGALAIATAPQRQRHVRLLAAGTAALAIVVALIWRTSAPVAPVLHISGSGSVIVVTSDDGRRWVVNTQRTSEVRGAYVIVFPQ